MQLKSPTEVVVDEPGGRRPKVGRVERTGEGDVVAYTQMWPYLARSSSITYSRTGTYYERP